jgi:hypothetical protein
VRLQGAVAWETRMLIAAGGIPHGSRRGWEGMVRRGGAHPEAHLAAIASSVAS